MAATTVREAMHEGCECIGENQTLLDAAKRMAELDVGAVPICGWMTTSGRAGSSPRPTSPPTPRRARPAGWSRRSVAGLLLLLAPLGSHISVLLLLVVVVALLIALAVWELKPGAETVGGGVDNSAKLGL